MNEVNIYGDNWTSQIVDTYFGGFNNAEMYDYLNLFFIILLVVFLIRLITLPFNR